MTYSTGIIYNIICEYLGIFNMLTLQEVLDGQADLDSLCADRELITPEIFAPNDYYGMAAVVKQYAGLPPESPLKAIIPHGICLDDNYLWGAERNSALPMLFYYPPYRRRIYEEKTDKVLIPSASPFLYVSELLKGHQSPERKGTIFFPYHSTNHVRAQMDLEKLASMLNSLDDEYKPVTVCIYWKDYLHGHHRPFLERGLRVVSAGHIFDPNFLYRLYHLCSQHRYACGNALGSQVFYSIKAGCSYFHMEFAYETLAAPEILERDTSKETHRQTELRQLFSVPGPEPTAEQVDAVDYYLGGEYLRSSAELCELFAYAEKLDRSFRVPSAGGLRFKVPPYYLRGIRRVRNFFAIVTHIHRRLV